MFSCYHSRSPLSVIASCLLAPAIRRFTVCIVLAAKPLPPRPTINEDDITEVFVKGSGPGGQKINKCNSAVQLKHLPTGFVVKSQATRSREQNRKIARRLLAEKLEEAENGSQSRTALKAAKLREKKRRRAKKARRKYGKKADEMSASGDDDEEEEEGGEEEEAAELGNRKDAANDLEPDSTLKSQVH